MIFNRPTDRFRESVEAAFEEARMLGHDSLGDEDLLPKRSKTVCESCADERPANA